MNEENEWLEAGRINTKHYSSFLACKYKMFEEHGIAWIRIQRKGIDFLLPLSDVSLIRKQPSEESYEEDKEE